MKSESEFMTTKITLHKNKDPQIFLPIRAQTFGMCMTNHLYQHMTVVDASWY